MPDTPQEQPLRTFSTLRAEACYVALSQKIKESAAGEAVHFYPSPGNWGDSLINAGSREFFAEFNIEAEARSRDSVKNVDRAHSRKALAIIGGGGGWNNNWNSTIDFSQAVGELYRSVVVLPSSFDPDVLPSSLAPNIFLASRAKGRSMERADLFCHDMAFFLRGFSSGEPRMGHPLIALRRDKERNSGSIDPDRNWDLSLLGNAFTSHLALVDIVSRFSAIYTDRLHIAILGGMLGTQVRLFDGNYGKNYGVFASSMRDFYPSVHMGRWEGFDWSNVFGVKAIGEPGYSGSVNDG